MKKEKTIGIALIVLALIIAGAVAYNNSKQRHVPLVYSPREMLADTWQQYKTEYLEPGTYRTLDKQRDNVTTSEGQSYTMLRAVWIDDKDTFDKSWKWTKDNLKRDDSLLAWLFGETSPGKYGIITAQGGNNTASDADSDIALSLVYAYARWGDQAYLAQALPILNDMWNKEVVTIKGKPYLAANNLEKTETQKDYIIVNPSYFAPYAYRIFAKVDKTHPWLSLIDTSYDVLNKSSAATYGAATSSNLPPNWIAINKKTAAVSAVPNAPTLTTDYSFDALRTSWRIALDYKWNAEPRAKQYLESLSFLKDEWQKNGALYTYTHDGKVLAKDETPAMYGGSIGYFMIATSTGELAEDVYKNKLQFLYNPDRQGWKERLSYYDDNWAWFGVALYHDLLPHLAI